MTNNLPPTIAARSHLRELLATDRDLRALAALAALRSAAAAFRDAVQRAEEVDHPDGWPARYFALEFVGPYLEDLDRTARQVRDATTLEGIEL